MSLATLPIYGQDYFGPRNNTSSRQPFSRTGYGIQQEVQPAVVAGTEIGNTTTPFEAEAPTATAEPVAEEPAINPCEPWIVSRTPYFDCGIDNPVSIDGCICGNKFDMPLTFGAYHWFHQSLNGQSGGYGIDGLRNTYFWYINADPRLDLGNDRAVGGHVELRLRETDTFRSFIDDQIWPWEAYGYLENERGKFKTGLLYKQFGLGWDGVFFGNAQYFDGMKLDADYGLSWEATRKIDDGFSVNSYTQFFFHEDQSNGSFAGADPESIENYTERNTGVVRIVPTWTTCNLGQVELGFSGLVGQLDSRRIDLQDDTATAYAIDLTYTRGPWKTLFEASQRFGLFHPVNYVSGGPSDQITNYLAGVHYTVGAATYRCSYSNSITENPGATQNMVVAGVTCTVTKNVDVYLEYVNQRVDGAELPGQNGVFFDSLEYVLAWHF